jgi:ABC-type multidrug transport system fused ATPase/permease subunit
VEAVTGLLVTGISLGNVATMMPNVSAASVAATRIFRLLDRESKIDPMSSQGKRVDMVEGPVLIQDGAFEYPTRPDVAVLRGLNMCEAPGKTIALVGLSGCGKSTVVVLLERFHDMRTGSLQLDGEKLRAINLQNAQSHMALVQ